MHKSNQEESTQEPSKLLTLETEYTQKVAVLPDARKVKTEMKSN